MNIKRDSLGFTLMELVVTIYTVVFAVSALLSYIWIEWFNTYRCVLGCCIVM